MDAGSAIFHVTIEKRLCMINFEEEIAKYGPSMEISQAEEAVLASEMTDIGDIIEKILQDKKDS